jgi:hypothetical protein
MKGSPAMPDAQKVQQTIADIFEGLVFLKTHNALVNDRGHSVFNFAVTSGAVYIVRNPLDVAISLAHHGGYSIDKAIETMALEDSESPVDDKLVHEIWSSWSRHVSSWTRKPHPAIRVMRYEDMLADSLASFAALARHLRLDATPAQIASAVDRRLLRPFRTKTSAWVLRNGRSRPSAFSVKAASVNGAMCLVGSR